MNAVKEFGTVKELKSIKELKGVKEEFLDPIATESVPLILPLSASIRPLAKVLSGETALRVLEALNEESMSAGELGKRLGLRLNTLKYNLDSLEKAGLIRVKKLRWSPRGRRIRIYAPMSRPIVLVPRASGPENSFVPGILEK